MKFEIKKITQPIDLGEFHEAYRGEIIHVWVNPPKSVRKEREDLLRMYGSFFQDIARPAESDPGKKSWLSRLKKLFHFGLNSTQENRLREMELKSYQWFADLWSQGDNPELHWTADELAQMNERDPALYRWLIKQSVLMVDMFHIDKKK